jgi:hypothetical protein
MEHLSHLNVPDPDHLDATEIIHEENIARTTEVSADS